MSERGDVVLRMGEGEGISGVRATGVEGVQTSSPIINGHVEEIAHMSENRPFPDVLTADIKGGAEYKEDEGASDENEMAPKPDRNDLLAHEIVTNARKVSDETAKKLYTELRSLNSAQKIFLFKRFGITDDQVREDGEIERSVRFDEEAVQPIEKILAWAMRMSLSHFGYSENAPSANLEGAINPIHRALRLTYSLIHSVSERVANEQAPKLPVRSGAIYRELTRKTVIEESKKLMQALGISGKNWEKEILPQLESYLRQVITKVPLGRELDLMQNFDSEQNNTRVVLRYLRHESVPKNDNRTEVVLPVQATQDVQEEPEGDEEEIDEPVLFRRAKLGKRDIRLDNTIDQDEEDLLREGIHILDNPRRWLLYKLGRKSPNEVALEIVNDYRKNQNRELFHLFKRMLLAGELNAQQIGPILPLLDNGVERRVEVNRFLTLNNGPEGGNTETYGYAYDLEHEKGRKDPQKIRDMHLAEQHVLRSVKKRMGL